MIVYNRSFDEKLLSRLSFFSLVRGGNGRCSVISSLLEIKVPFPIDFLHQADEQCYPVIFIQFKFIVIEEIPFYTVDDVESLRLIKRGGGGMVSVGKLEDFG